MNLADIVAATAPVAEALEFLGLSYYIGGSVASSTYGIARYTQANSLLGFCYLKVCSLDIHL
jgi:hypothetical protein